jgi:hypothetical protein
LSRSLKDVRLRKQRGKKRRDVDFRLNPVSLLPRLWALIDSDDLVSPRAA